MAGGWSKDGAVQDQIDASIDDAVKQARSQLPTGKGAEICDECGENIPEDRQKAVVGVRYCLNCQLELDKQSQSVGINRRGSKDSQLR